MKKKLATLLVAVFAFSSMIACGDDKTTSKESATTAVESTVEETVASVEASDVASTEAEGTVEETATTETKEAVQGEEKTIVVSVVDDQGETTTFEVETEAEVLYDALQNIDGFTMEGTQEDWGFFVTTINGLTANYDEDMTYWSLYENDEMALYGVSELPVVDGNEYSFVFETYVNSAP